MRKAAERMREQPQRIMKLESRRVIINEQINALKHTNQVLKEK